MDAPNYITNTSATWDYPGGRSITIEYALAPGHGFSRQTRIFGGVLNRGAVRRDVNLLPHTVQDPEVWTRYKESSFEGGHLVALALGGPDHSLNIAPMSKGANSASGTWGIIEQKIRSTINSSVNGVAQIDLSLGYDDSIDPCIPAWVRGTIGTTKVALSIRPPSPRTNIIGRAINRLFRDIEDLARTHNLVGTSDRPHTPLDVLDQSSPAAQDLRNRIREIPLLATYPQGGIPRKSTNGTLMEEQRLLMMLYNRYRNGGLLMAEDPQNLGLLVNEWQAQIDHISPRSKSTNRYYKNFRVLHHRTNNKRGNRGVNTGGAQKRVRKPPVRYSPY